MGSMLVGGIDVDEEERDGGTRRAGPIKWEIDNPRGAREQIEKAIRINHRYRAILFSRSSPSLLLLLQHHEPVLTQRD